MNKPEQELPRWSWSDACARRMARHGLTSPIAGATPAQVAALICGAQAQVQQAAEWSIGLRMEGTGLADVRRALWNEHTLIRTYGPRGTVHVHASQTLPMWTAVLSSQPSANGALNSELRLTDAKTEQLVRAIDEALTKSDLTVDELHQEVIARAGAWAAERVLPAFSDMWPVWRQAMPLAAARGVLCFGPKRGQKVTYSHPRRWSPDFRSPDKPWDALAELVRRYLYAYGPATPSNFAQWLAVPSRWAQDLFDSMNEELLEIDFEGARAWLAADDSDFIQVRPQGIKLLPYFDSFLIGSHPRALLFQGPAKRALSSTGQAGTYPVILLDGKVAGRWHQKRRSAKAVDITVELFDQLTESALQELDAEVKRLGAFLDAKTTWIIGPVTIASHR